MDVNSQGNVRKVFSSTGVSEIGNTKGEKTLVIEGTDTFTVDAEVSKDDGLTWNVIESFSQSVGQNFEWKGKNSVIRFNCTSFTANPVTLVFE